jgi:hypothetical protein
MKTLTFLSALSFLVPALALAGGEGLYAYAHEIGFGGGYTKKACLKEKGRWENGACYLPTSDLVTLSKSESDWSVEVNTIRTNGKDCVFQGKAKEISGHELLAVMESEENWEGPQPVPTVCELKVTFLDPNTLKVEKLDARKCEYICASMVGLDVPKAVRVHR